jgi:5-methyltetrahydropteroyltriglutamate--homocysteine methyltransferase
VSRFLTTHVGSLPRPEYLLDLVFAREEGVAIAEDDFEAAVLRATGEIVARQKQAGVDIVNDGEMSKPSYATYIKHRLSGFGGEAGQYEFADLEAFPGAKAQVFGNKGRAKRSAPACTAPIEVIDMEAPRIDAERLVRLADGDAGRLSSRLAERARHRDARKNREGRKPR